MARQNKHLAGKPEGLSLPDLTMTAEPAAYLTDSFPMARWGLGRAGSAGSGTPAQSGPATAI
jgi:hypothetical protein